MISVNLPSDGLLDPFRLTLLSLNGDPLFKLLIFTLVSKFGFRSLSVFVKTNMKALTVVYSF